MEPSLWWYNKEIEHLGELRRCQGQPLGVSGKAGSITRRRESETNLLRGVRGSTAMRCMVSAWKPVGNRTPPQSGQRSDEAHNAETIDCSAYLRPPQTVPLFARNQPIRSDETLHNIVPRLPDNKP